MAKKSAAKDPSSPYRRVVARNKRARYEFHLGDSWEAGIVLVGSEVKTLRGGQGAIAQAYARFKDGELWLVGANIPEYAPANRFNHEPTRWRKLLLRRSELDKIERRMKKGGGTIVPIELYFDERGKVKIKLAYGTGKKHHDKRQDLRKADARRAMDRIRKGR